MTDHLMRPEVVNRIHKDPDRVSKRELLRVVGIQESLIAKLKVELFCADPWHPFFKGAPEMQLARLRMESILRRCANAETIDGGMS